MNLIEGELNQEELKEYITTRPAAKALHELKANGVSVDALLNESIIYYERVLGYQGELLKKYLSKYGSIL